ncbi:hypothetical protein M918_20220 [Clostridium sp. BL8]|uniref:HD domain-containing phosphohydrolase n=1 Tax=Clostridium sp. BL8 TaxID=1354301 RepID=UPI00038A05EE|nr:HD domain-containing phosphohydrolase [Clostridium sp. BL8]EQB89562.1 hypothetical protein M918_20220 [Clostridium sp. BL8]
MVENIINFIERDYRYIEDISENQMNVKQLILESFQMISRNTDLFPNLYIAYDDKIVSTIDDRYEDFSPKDRDWYELAIISGDLVTTKPYKDILTDEVTVTISKKVKGTEHCVVGLDLSQNKINEIINNTISKESFIEKGFILDEDGNFVAHSDTTMIGKSIFDRTMNNYEYIEPYLKEVFDKKSGVIELYNEGYEYSLVYKATESNWRVVYVVDRKVINSNTYAYGILLISIYVFSFISLNSAITFYYIKRNKAVRLKERAESAERELIVHRNKLEEIIKEKTENIEFQSEKLKKLNITIIDNLADIVEFRDLESGQHIKRIKEYTYLLTEKAAELYPEVFGVCLDKIDLLCKASALHDIGKIGIPDSILLKPGKLTKEEFEIMKTHTTIGDELCHRILEKYDPELAQFGHDICRYHHERADGRGYPDGLLENEIPPCAQIVALADVYDALIEKRPYKRAFHHNEAIQMILNGECGKFSDKLMTCLQILEKDFEKISILYGEKE